MAKNQIVKPAKAVKSSESILDGLLAGAYSNGERGKMARPDGISDNHWATYSANRRVSQAIKMLKGVQRLAANEHLTSEQRTAILALIRERYIAIKTAFESPEPKAVKIREGRLF